MLKNLTPVTYKLTFKNLTIKKWWVVNTYIQLTMYSIQCLISFPSSLSHNLIKVLPEDLFHNQTFLLYL